MADTIEKIRIVDSAIRTALLALVLSILGYGGCLGYNHFVVPGQLAQKELDKLREDYEVQTVALQESRQKIDKLQTSLRLLKIDRRLANIKILEKGIDEATGKPFLNVDFWEVSHHGDTPVGDVRTFRLNGDKMYVDCWIVQFEDEYVENADALRNASLCVLKSIWGDMDGPNGGHVLDYAGSDDQVPVVYQGSGDASEFEHKIWSDFWAVSNDPQRQKELGIRASHGQVNYMQVEEGRTYQVEVRASGGASFRTLDR
ncbi:MAG: hypothetical protein KF851_18855 [Pirellulaceae bacterium]|nr:hypothetical protein [Pirellulaceae bacterium]